ncbi:FKBP-type peptidyl-prolyl cis-trans isomerase [Natronococcus wangiae]|uniref:FKBP-type peptidyl-prolyl cis-trans isomerase n=1 Tax=Natronococcus wangiae TaxID=3068275 RepID=UPI00273FAFED|nr:peptidylprolyl isomerase [Natronococcus sp. AD5]
MAITTGDTVTVEYTARLADGSVFDTTRERVADETGLAEQQPDREYGPLTVEVGTGELLDGVEEALVGMEENDEATIEVPPEKGYGKRSDDSIQEYDTAEFKQMIDVETLEEGMQFQTPDGDVGKISHAGPETVRLDLHHDLAGKTLKFDIEILDVS